VLRFHLDQHVDSALARGLRLRGIDVTTTGEADLQGASDLEHLAYALAEDRVVVTQDQDFLRLHRTGVRHAGIVFTRHGTRSIGEIIAHLELMHQCLEPTDVRGEVEYL
jgi:predicted nuclease of predicted toxin-antitoxin system